MRSRKTRLLALFVFVTAALVPGAAVFVRPAYACTLQQPVSPEEFVAESEFIVIGRVSALDSGRFTLVPEAFLKGPASGEPLAFEKRDAMCPLAELSSGDRALVYVIPETKAEWPLITQVYTLRDGHAYRQGEVERSEVEVVSAIRGITGQYAVPAATEDEGAGIDWGNTVLPLGVVLLIIFGIGLVLMRVWHRIDPS